MEQSEYSIKPREVIKEAFGTQTRVEIVFGVEDDFTSNVNEERKLLQRTISYYVEATMGHLVKLKRRMNTLVAINRLPEELFSHIILLSGVLAKETGHSYLIYTWVCLHWRSIIIQNPIFWRSVRLRASGSKESLIHPFIYEMLQRSKSLELEMVLMSNDNRRFSPSLQNIFDKKSDRICRLWLEILNDRNALRVISGTRFPALRGFSYTGGYDDFYRLLPVTLASDNLDTLRCTLLHTRDMTSMDRLAIPMFNRLRNLSLSLDKGLLQSVLDMLHNNRTLQNLRLQVNTHYRIYFANQTILPELEYLSTDNLSVSEHIFPPKLSSLDLSCGSFMETFPEAFNVSLIKYLYIFEFSGNFILGLKERILPFPESLLLTKAKDFVEDVEDVISTEHIQSVQNIFSVDDTLSDSCPRNCFRLRFRKSKFIPVLEMMLSPLISRLQNLRELYLLNRALLEYEEGLEGIVSHAPFVEKLVVQYGDRLLDFIRPLNDPALCPRLKHLSYVTFYQSLVLREEINDYAENVGKTLTECLQSRYQAHGHELKHIVLHACPPLPDLWLHQIRNLGTMVVTANVESVFSTN